MVSSEEKMRRDKKKKQGMRGNIRTPEKRSLTFRFSLPLRCGSLTVRLDLSESAKIGFGLVGLAFKVKLSMTKDT